MEAVATINVRMSEALKDGGSRVLEQCDVSPSEAVRSLYRYMSKYQQLPACLDVARDSNAETVYDRRRKLLRSVAGSLDVQVDGDNRADRAARIEEKYGELL